MATLKKKTQNNLTLNLIYVNLIYDHHFFYQSFLLNLKPEALTSKFISCMNIIVKITCFLFSQHLVGGGGRIGDNVNWSLLHWACITFFWKVPSNAATITVLPRSAISSQNSTTSLNWKNDDLIERFSLKYLVKFW